MVDIRENAKNLATEYLEKGDPTGWFDALYREAGGDSEHIPWADLEPNRFLRRWAESVNLRGQNRTALVVGCGLGDDARFLDELGFRVTAFDVSPEAISWARKIHADTKINFYTVDLFKSPKGWEKAFDLVLEVYTIQALPPDLREKTIEAIGRFVAAGGGRLVVVTRGCADDEKVEGPPWPLSGKDLAWFEKNGLRQVGLTVMLDPQEALEEPLRRFVAVYEKEA